MIRKLVLDAILDASVHSGLSSCRQNLKVLCLTFGVEENDELTYHFEQMIEKKITQDEFKVLLEKHLRTQRDNEKFKFPDNSQR